MLEENRDFIWRGLDRAKILRSSVSFFILRTIYFFERGGKTGKEEGRRILFRVITSEADLNRASLSLSRRVPHTFNVSPRLQ